VVQNVYQVIKINRFTTQYENGIRDHTKILHATEECLWITRTFTHDTEKCYLWEWYTDDSSSYKPGKSL